MYKGTFKSILMTHLGNASGWRTNRKIVVFESDDWGNIRLNSKTSRDQLIKSGLVCSAIHYDSVDSLESDSDLEFLFEVLSSVKDSNGRSAVFTPMCNVANPDFDAIKASNYSNYYVQPLHKTLEEYPYHSNVLNLWQKGKSEGIFIPGFHNREHFNIRRILKHLKDRTPGFMECFDRRSLGILNFKGVLIENYINALHPESFEEIEEFKEIIKDGVEIFKNYMGYYPRTFIAPNAEEPRELEKVLSESGVKYMTRSKRRNYPVGDGSFKKEFNWLGKRNNAGQICIVRNCFFEPVTWGEHHEITDWVDNCLKEIEISFNWKKPAVVSTHRVNYVGFIEPENRTKGLKELKKLLNAIITKWPDVEFLSTEELGDTIIQ
jgi:hypothetical protein